MREISDEAILKIGPKLQLKHFKKKNPNLLKVQFKDFD